MKKVCLVAVDIRSTHNIGSIFRTADGFGAEIALVGICPRPKGAQGDDRLPHVIEKAHKAISKTALGAESSVKWRYFPNTEEAINTLKSEEYKIIAVEQSENSVDMRKLIISGNTALLLGEEVDGLSPKVLKLCDDVFEIAMKGHKESFNVSVSAGIALYQSSLST
jgi:tRNA G18 (ribose-2'-O)-methylase SpoU